VILIVKSSFALPAALAASMLLSACGQTGPLYMPKPPKHGAAASVAPAEPAAPASISVPPAPAAGTTVPSGESNANNTQAITPPPSSVPASR
jgi:predicted small lipoprotein YifL